MFSPEVTINGEVYKLARKDVLERYGAGYTARSWSSEKVPVSAPRTIKRNIQRGSIDNEYIVTYDDWSGGICDGVTGDIDNKVIFSSNVETYHKGILKPASGCDRTDILPTNGGPAVKILNFGTHILVAIGSKVFRIEAPDKYTEELNATYDITDMIVFNSMVIVAVGSKAKIYKRVTATWSQATDNVYADKFAIANGELWKVYGGNISKLVGSDPLEFNDWGSAFTVGQSNAKVNALLGYNDKLAVVRSDGMFMGDSALIFPNVLPQMEYGKDADNGKGATLLGDKIFYPCANGDVLMYTPGAVEEVGIKKLLASADIEFENFNPNIALPIPGYRITAMASGANYLWAATMPVDFPQDSPTKVLGSVDPSSFVDFTTEATDSNRLTYGTVGTFMDAYNHATSADWLYIGYDSTFYGVSMDILGPHYSSMGGIKVQYFNTYTNDWEDFDYIYHDTGFDSSTYLMKSGTIRFDKVSTPDHVFGKTTVNGSELYWIRIGNGAGNAGSYFKFGTIKVLTAPARSNIYRGRPRTANDTGSNSIIWEHCYTVSTIGPIGAIMEVREPFDKDLGGTIPEKVPYGPNGTLIFADSRRVYMQYLHDTRFDSYLWTTNETPRVLMPADDMGTPDTNKEFLEIKVKGDCFPPNGKYSLWWKTDTDTLFQSVASTLNIDEEDYSVSLSGVTGKTIQLMIQFGPTSNQLPPEIHKIMVRYREKPTYKSRYTMLLECGDKQVTNMGSVLPDGSVQLAALDALINTSVTMIDPLGASKTVTVDSIRQMEFLQDKNNKPIMLVEVVATEV